MLSMSSEVLLETHRAPRACERGNSDCSLVGLLLGLSGSVRFNSANRYRGDHLPGTSGCVKSILFTTAPSSLSGQCKGLVRAGRKRRRDVLDAFFDTSSNVPAGSPSSLRERTRQLFCNAKENIRQVSKTHASMLELLCRLIAPRIASDSAAARNGNDEELSEAEAILYIVLRTSVAAAPTWQRPPVVPRCWLSSSVTAVVERSMDLQRIMCWSCDPDPVVMAALGVDAIEHRRFVFGAFNMPFWSDVLSSHNGSVDSDYAGSSRECASLLYSSERSRISRSWGTLESSEVRRLFDRKRTHVMANSDDSLVPLYGGVKDGPDTRESSPLDTFGAGVPGNLAEPRFSFFREVYPADSPFCSILFVALHRSVIGQQDPYMLLTLQLVESKCKRSPLSSKVSAFRSPVLPRAIAQVERSGTSFPSITISSELISAAHLDGSSKSPERKESELETASCSGAYDARGSMCSRGVVAMLQWSCRIGTLFLRLLHLCSVADQPEWRVSLGQYGKSAITALRRLLFVLQRRVANLSERPSGPRGVSFNELIAARQRLHPVVQDIMALSDIFHVHAEDVWDPTLAIGELSSATLLSALYKRYEQRLINKLGCGDGSIAVFGQHDVVGDVFVAVLQPFHRMLWWWLSAGELHDPFGEFFVVESNSASTTGFLVDSSPQRLPAFIPLRAANELLQAGVSLRALCNAARYVESSVKRSQKLQQRVVEDVDAAVMTLQKTKDAMGIGVLLQDFMELLLGRRQFIESSTIPKVDLLSDEGALLYWQTFYSVCDTILLPSPEVTHGGSSAADGWAAGTATGAPIVEFGEHGQASKAGLGVSLSSVSQGSASIVEVEIQSVGESVSHTSRAMTARQEVVSVDRTSASQAVSKSGSTSMNAALRLEYEFGLLRCKAQQRLPQWKAQRQALNLARAAAISSAVDELHELYERVTRTQLSDTVVHHEGSAEEKVEMGGNFNEHATNGLIVKPLRQIRSACSEQVSRVDTPRDNEICSLPFVSKEVMDAPLNSSASWLSKSKLPLHRIVSSKSFADASSDRSQHLTGYGSARAVGGAGDDACNEQMAPAASDGFVHAPEMYVVADINDDEYLMKRAGPHVTDTTAVEEILTQLAVQEERIRDFNVSSEDYQKECTAVALEMLHSVGVGREGGSTVACNAISNIWWTDPTRREEDIPLFIDEYDITTEESSVSGRIPQGSSSAPAMVNSALMLTEQQAKNLLHCSHYYLSLGHYAANYLTHKALQVLLLDPYGILYRLSEQFLDVCLMQNSRVADRLTSLWQQLTQGAIEEGYFNPLSTLAAMNSAFVEEWESCVSHGSATVHLKVMLASGISKHEGAGAGETVVVENEDFHGEEGDGKKFPSSAGPWRSSQYLPMSQKGNENEEGGQGGTVVTSAASSSFDFISQLCLLHESTQEGLWPLPNDCLSVYGDLFSTLLFWSSVTQLITRVWRAGIKSSVQEVFFFCNAARTVMGAVSQHMWFLIGGYAREYRSSLKVRHGVNHSYRSMEQFSRGHKTFLECCRFAAMLTPDFARARQQIYGLVQQLEEVEQLITTVAEVKTESVSHRQLHRARDPTPEEKSPPVEAEKWVPGQKKRKKKGMKRTAGSPTVSVDNNSSPRSSICKGMGEQPGGIGSPSEGRTKTYETDHWRKVRSSMRRHLRSFVKRTEMLIESLASAQSNIIAASVGEVRAIEDEEAFRGSVHVTGRTAALTSLIRVLELMHISMKDRL